MNILTKQELQDALARDGVMTEIVCNQWLTMGSIGVDAMAASVERAVIDKIKAVEVDLILAARAGRLRQAMHGVNATDARELLREFVAEVDRQRGVR